MTGTGPAMTWQASSGGRLRAALAAGRFVVTAEVAPPRDAGADAITAKAQLLQGWVDAANVTDAYMQTRRKGFGTEVRRRVMLGTYALSSGYYDAYYLKAQKVRTLIAQDFERAFQHCDAIVAQVLTAPFHMVRLTRHSGPVRFRRPATNGLSK